MNTKEFITREKKYLNWLIQKGTPFKQSVYDVIAVQSKRIFSEGKNSAGTAMKSPNGGVYDSTTPLYVNSKLIKGGSKLGKPKGKTGKSQFKNGKPHKLNYVESYKELKNKLGRRTDVVTLQLNYDLFSDWAGSPKTSNFSAPKTVKPTQISNYEYQIRLSRPKNRDKASGLEDRYGNIFKMTQKEKQVWKKSLDFNFKRYREQYLRDSQEAPVQPIQV